MQKIFKFAFLLIFIVVSCESKKDKNSTSNIRQDSAVSFIGKVEIADQRLTGIIDPDSKCEILAEGFDWSEGPVWSETLNGLLFSDIPPNQVRLWKENEGDSLYLYPSGYTGMVEREGEPGSNGLLIDSNNHLVLCQHGDRRIATMNSSLNNPEPEFTTLVDSYNGKRLNSPNDACFDSQGNLYFTDPPYGLAGPEHKELDFQGVFLLKPYGELILLTDTLTRPNGIALFPGEKQLLVANSDPEKSYWTIYDVGEEGKLSNGRLFYDATSVREGKKGLPDGLKIRDDGIVFATGPGGVWIFDREGKHLGTINTTQATANCAFSPDQKTLYMTADMYLLRISLK
jgi:gluconolactonase